LAYSPSKASAGGDEEQPCSGRNEKQLGLKPHDCDAQHNQRQKADQSVHQDGQKRCCPSVGALPHQVKGLHHVSPHSAEHEEVEKGADHEEAEHPPVSEADILHAQQNVPAQRSQRGNNCISAERRNKPDFVSSPPGVPHLRPLRRIAKDPVQQPDCHEDLDNRPDAREGSAHWANWRRRGMAMIGGGVHEQVVSGQVL
jgi:hypothetical protein